VCINWASHLARMDRRPAGPPGAHGRKRRHARLSIDPSTAAGRARPPFREIATQPRMADGSIGSPESSPGGFIDSSPTTGPPACAPRIGRSERGWTGASRMASAPPIRRTCTVPSAKAPRAESAWRHRRPPNLRRSHCDSICRMPRLASSGGTIFRLSRFQLFLRAKLRWRPLTISRSARVRGKRACASFSRLPNSGGRGQLFEIGSKQSEMCRLGGGGWVPASDRTRIRISGACSQPDSRAGGGSR
jgi:hypothetical protein